MIVNKTKKFSIYEYKIEKIEKESKIEIKKENTIKEKVNDNTKEIKKIENQKDNKKPEKNDVLAKSYSNTANTYEIMKNYQKAIEFQEKALKVYKNHNQNENLIFINECYTYLSDYYQKLKDFNQVLIYEGKSLEILKKIYTYKHEKTNKKIS